MNVFRLSRKQIILRLVLSAVLLGTAIILLWLRACSHWQPVEITLHMDQNVPSPYIDPDGMTQETRILPPEGYERIPAEDGSFLQFMRQMELFPDGSSIYDYHGNPLPNANAAAVYTLPVGTEGYQQCADTVILLWSTYFRKTGQTERIVFSLSNGYQTSFEKWCTGSRILAFGDIAWSMPLAAPDDSEQAFHDYLMTVMRYAGTLSLEAESQPISVEDAKAGDIICHGGTPGHVVVIVDEARNADGARCFLLAQGFMPAQSAHIIAGNGRTQNMWYTEAELSADPITLSSYVFHGSDALRRWKDGF